jgi:predicted DNA-binding protein
MNNSTLIFAKEKESNRQFTKTLSLRVETALHDRLHLLLIDKYGGRKDYRNSMSKIMREAILSKIEEIENTNK